MSNQQVIDQIDHISDRIRNGLCAADREVLSNPFISNNIYKQMANEIAITLIDLRGLVTAEPIGSDSA